MWAAARGSISRMAAGRIIKMDDYGKVDVFTGATDMGQGADTVIAQMVAEELGLAH